jgi:hypothetical protein
VAADEMAPWIIDPKNSKLYRFQTFLITLALLAELVVIPLVWLNPLILITYENFFHSLNAFWVLNMLFKLQTIKPANPSDNPIEIAGFYLVSEFAWDLAATLPTILAR